MSVSMRVFFVGEDDRLRPIPLKRFEQLRRNLDPPESFPEYAGQRVRCAMVFLETRDRRPVRSIKTDYNIITFDNQGRLDLEDAKRLALERLASTYMLEPKSGSVVNAQSRFLQKQYEDKYRWQPSVGIEHAIAEAVFGLKRQR